MTISKGLDEQEFPKGVDPSAAVPPKTAISAGPSVTTPV